VAVILTCIILTWGCFQVKRGISLIKELVCWKCGIKIEERDLPISRHSECRTCHADLHICIMCRFYNPRLDKKCEHLTADAVREKERSNFCDQFRPRKDAHKPVVDVASEKAKLELASLFGVAASDETDVVKLAQQEKDKARAELEKLFGKNDNNNNEK